MAKRMKLLPEVMFNDLMKMKDEYEQKLLQNRENVLTSKDIPVELKSVIYEEMCRELQSKREYDENVPFLVKMKQDAKISESPIGQQKNEAQLNVKNEKQVVNAEPEQEEEDEWMDTLDNVDESPLDILDQTIRSGRGNQIANYLKDIGISWNSNKEVTIDNKKIPESNIDAMLNCLKNAQKKRKDVRGMDSLLSKIRKDAIPKDTFSAGVYDFLTEKSKSNVTTRGKSQHGHGVIRWQRFK